MDTYKTIAIPIEEVIFKEKSSKFLGYAFPVTSEEEIKVHLEEVKKAHFSARHWCYAWRLGYGTAQRYRANDDGEPNNTAGIPIYGQIQSFELTNILVIVVPSIALIHETAGKKAIAKTIRSKMGSSISIGFARVVCSSGISPEITP